MSVAIFLAQLRARGVEITADKGMLSIHAPRGVITPSERLDLVKKKPEILILLESSPPTPEPNPGSGVGEVPEDEGATPIPCQSCGAWLRHPIFHLGDRRPCCLMCGYAVSPAPCSPGQPMTGEIVGSGPAVVAIGDRVHVIKPPGYYKQRGEKVVRYHPVTRLTAVPAYVIELRPAWKRRGEGWAVVTEGLYPLSWLEKVDPGPAT